MDERKNVLSLFSFLIKKIVTIQLWTEKRGLFKEQLWLPVRWWQRGNWEMAAVHRDCQTKSVGGNGTHRSLQKLDQENVNGKRTAWLSLFFSRWTTTLEQGGIWPHQSKGPSCIDTALFLRKLLVLGLGCVGATGLEFCCIPTAVLPWKLVVLVLVLYFFRGCRFLTDAHVGR
jgi:hypothetical protein